VGAEPDVVKLAKDLRHAVPVGSKSGGAEPSAIAAEVGGGGHVNERGAPTIPRASRLCWLHDIDTQPAIHEGFIALVLVVASL